MGGWNIFLRGVAGRRITVVHCIVSLGCGVLGVIAIWHGMTLLDRAILGSDSASASHGFVCVSAPCYRSAENIMVASVIVAPFEFSDIQRQIFAANFVEAAHNAALQERPETINRLSMDRAVDILASAMPNSTVFLQFTLSNVASAADPCPQPIPNAPCQDWRCPTYVNRFSIRSRPRDFARHQTILGVAITIQSFEHNLFRGRD